MGPNIGRSWRTLQCRACLYYSDAINWRVSETAVQWDQATLSLGNRWYVEWSVFQRAEKKMPFCECCETARVGWVRWVDGNGLREARDGAEY